MKTNINKLSIPDYIIDLVNINSSQFLIHGLIVFTIIFVISIYTILNLEGKSSLGIFTVAVSTIFINSLVHCIEAVFSGMYVPGLVTSAVLILPHNGYLLYQIKEEKNISIMMIMLYLLIGGILQIPIALTASWLGKYYI